MVKTINIYGHYGSNNHGNEAIVRGACELFNDYQVNLHSFIPNSDYKYHLNDICKIYPMKKELNRYAIKNILGKLLFKIKKNDYYRDNIRYQEFLNRAKEGDIYLFEAGDQLFENKQLLDFYYWLNNILKEKKVKLIFFLGSVPANKINKLYTLLDTFDIIIARESISYKALQNTSLKDKVMFSPCCAFIMKPEETALPVIFKKPVVGLTFGYLAQGKENYNLLLMRNIKNLIQYLIMNTDYNVALIPHVNVAKELSDYKFFNDLIANNDFDTDRVSLVKENSANKQKYVISNCELYLTVRTHVSIAAYSTFVPTVVLSYSQKSLGIATDIFKTTENHTLDIKNLENEKFLINSFNWLEKNKVIERQHLENMIPQYLEPLSMIKEKIVEG